MKRAQSAAEYLIVVALALGIIVPTAYVFFNFSSVSSAELEDSQVYSMGQVLLDNAQNMYYSGKDSKVVVDVTIPPTVNDIFIIDNRELVFNVSTPSGDTEVVFFSNVNISSRSCVDNICDMTSLAEAGLTSIRVITGTDGTQVFFEQAT